MKSDPIFIKALFELSAERGYGYILRKDVEARAAEIAMRLPPPPLPPPPPPLPPPPRLPPALPPLPPPPPPPPLPKR